MGKSDVQNNKQTCKNLNIQAFICVTIGLILLLSFLSCGTANETQSIVDSLMDSPTRVHSYSEIHGPISISGDQDFNDTAYAEGWLGNGTVINPFIIEGYEIDTTGLSAHCISIVHTSVHFTIKGCNLTGAYSPYAGIRLHNVTNGEIRNTTLSDNYRGIFADNCEWIHIENNTLEGDPNAILIYYSNTDRTKIINNTFFGGDFGIELVGSSYNQISHNYLAGVADSEVYLIGNTYYNTLSENTIIAEYNTLSIISGASHNNITGNDMTGVIYARGTSSNNSISWNVLTRSKSYGYITYSIDSASNNYTWNYFSHGGSDSSSVQDLYRYNYYAGYSGYDENQDGFGDTPWTIMGSAGTIDFYPQLNPPGTNVTWLDTPSNQAVLDSEQFIYDLDATASPPCIDMWWIDDETYFNIDALGTITNCTKLTPGDYDIQVWVNDTLGNELTDSFTLTVADGSPPELEEIPGEILFELDTLFVVNLNATDYSGIHSWWINDTLNFDINSEGIITTTGALTSGHFVVQIWVNDTLGYTSTLVISVDVVDANGPVLSPEPTTQYVEPGDHLRLDLNATDFTGIDSWLINDTVHFSIDADGVITSNYVLPEAIYRIEVCVSDPLGHTSSLVFNVHVVRTIRVAIVYGDDTNYPEDGPWDHLNEHWADYGNVRLIVDYTSLASPGFTLEDIENTGADVLVLGYYYTTHSENEMNAIMEYVEQGHGLYVSSRRAFWENDLWEFFGLNEPVPTYEYDWTSEPYEVICPSHPIFFNVPSSFTTYATLCFYPTDTYWTQENLDGAVILASISNLAVILEYRGMIYWSSIPEYMPHELYPTSVQILYNIFVWSNYTIPEHQLGIESNIEEIFQVGEETTLNFIIHNRGTSPESDFDVELFINGTYYDSTTIPWLESNSSTLVQFSWTPMTDGMYNLTLVVDAVPGEYMICDNRIVRVVWVGDAKFVLWDMSHNNDGPLDYSYLCDELVNEGFSFVEFWDSELNSTVLGHYNILVIVQPRSTYTSIELDAIHDFVMNGGGLIVIGDYDEAIMDSLTLFAGFDWGFPSNGGLSGPINVAHPVTYGVVSVRFPSYGLKFNVTWPAIGFKGPSDLFVVGASQVGLGKVVCASDNEVFTDGYIEDYSNLILAKNSFTWTSFPARTHDVMAYVNVHEVVFVEGGNPITFSVVNTGTSVEYYVLVRFYINNTQILADVVDILNTSTVIMFSYLWSPPIGGVYTLTMYVEPVPGEYWTSDNIHSPQRNAIDRRIEIYSDADFEIQGWPGSGTEEDPYRLDNLWMIAFDYWSTCIRIEDTTVYFVISNCSFFGDDLTQDSAIILSNVRNGRILDNSFTHCQFGVWGSEISSCIFSNNTFTDCSTAFWMEMSLHNEVTQNIFEHNDDAVMILCMNFTTFERNILRYNINGLSIDYRSNETEVRWNTFIDNTQNALDDGEFNVYYENYWSDYTGVDADFDGYGDTPHEIPGLANSVDTHPIALPFEGPYITWDEVPTDIFLDHGEELSSQLYVNSYGEISYYWINDTTYFDINIDGILFNSTMLLFGTHALEIRVYDGYGHYCSAIITIYVDDESPPEWVTDPALQVVELGDAWTYELDATDISGLDTWWLNDTLRFSIDSDGVISMTYLLPVGTYWLQVNVNDTAGNTLIAVFGVQIQDTQAPEWAYQPGNQQIPYGDAFSYPVSAIDLSGIDYYWIDDTINFAIDGSGTITNLVILDCGTYDLEIRAYDIYGHYCEAVIVISIIDGTLPSIDHPADIEYDEGDTGSSITWHPLDDNPVRYEIWLDDTLLRSGDWNSSSEIIIISVDGLPAGVYVYTVIVVDYGEHSASDSVLVRVYETSTTTTTTTTTTETSTTTTSTESSSTTTTAPPLEMMSLVIGLGVGVIATSVIIILVLLRKGLIRKT